MMAATRAAFLWRMGTSDYCGVGGWSAADLRLADDDAPWAQRLVTELRERSAQVYEEDLHNLLSPTRGENPTKLGLTQEGPGRAG